MTYTNDQLRHLAQRAQAHMADELSLFGVELDDDMVPLITAGMVRSVLAVVDTAPLSYVTPQPVLDYVAANPPFAGAVTAAPVDQDNTVMELTLPQPIVEPSTNGQHEPIDEDATTPRPASPSAAAAASAKRRAELTEVLDCLRSLAVDGIMPAQTLYDERKPPHLLSSKLLGGRFGVLWQELAEQAGLRYNGRGPALTGKRK